MKPDVNQLARVLKCAPADIEAAWVVGSRVYGCAGSRSDWDVVVVKRGVARQDLVFRPGLNVIVHGRDSFLESMKQHSMLALECWYSPDVLVPFLIRYTFRPDAGRLRTRALETAAADWAKGVKLWAEDPEKARKKLYHAIRVLMFARQLSEQGRIVDFSEANGVWEAARDSEDAILELTPRWEAARAALE